MKTASLFLGCLVTVSLLLAAGAPPVQTPHPARRIHGFVGEVVTVAAATGEISARETLHAGSQRQTSFQVTVQTRILCGKTPCPLANVHPNDHVTIKYVLGPRKVRQALVILVTPVAAPFSRK